jgi:hypothetical protein
VRLRCALLPLCCAFFKFPVACMPRSRTFRACPACKQRSIAKKKVRFRQLISDQLFRIIFLWSMPPGTKYRRCDDQSPPINYIPRTPHSTLLFTASVTISSHPYTLLAQIINAKLTDQDV